MNNALTDTSGTTHNSACVNNAYGSLSNEAGLNGFSGPEDMAKSWTQEFGHPYSVQSILATWLSDGTIECICCE